MGTFNYEIEIERPAAEVWATVSDFGRPSRYSPAVSNSYLTGNGAESAAGQSEIEVGTTRHCDLTVSGASIEERVVELRDGERLAIEIYDGAKAPPFKSARAVLAVEELSDERSKLRASLDYRLRFGPLGAAMDRAIVGRRFGPAFGASLAGIKHHVETGVDIDEATDLTTELAALRTVEAPA